MACKSVFICDWCEAESKPRSDDRAEDGWADYGDGDLLCVGCGKAREQAIGAARAARLAAQRNDQAWAAEVVAGDSEAPDLPLDKVRIFHLSSGCTLLIASSVPHRIVSHLVAVGGTAAAHIKSVEQHADHLRAAAGLLLPTETSP